MQPSFNLSGLAAFLPVRCSQWSKVVTQAAGAFMTRGILSIVIEKKLHEERVFQNDSREAAIASLSVIGSHLQIAPQFCFSDLDLEKLVRSIFAKPLDPAILRNDAQFEQNSFIFGPDAALIVPNAQGNFVFNAERFDAWMGQVFDANNPVRSQNNCPQGAPAAAKPAPVAGEIHPWLFGGLLNVNLADGTDNTAILQDNPLWSFELVARVMVMSPQGNRFREKILANLTTAVLIVTCAGSISPARLNKILRQIRQETGSLDIEVDQDTVIKGFYFLRAIWDRQTTGQKFEEMFTNLKAEVTKTSLILGTMVEQTRNKMLTGIVTVIQAIRTYEDFPWAELNERIKGVTGKDEMAAAAAFGDTVNNCHWIGWTYIFQTAQPGHTNKQFPNILYTAIRLQILAGGVQSLKQYEGLKNMISERYMIDAWVAQYVQNRQIGVNYSVQQGAASSVVDHMRQLDLN
ncbi:uncharacterized protein LOC131191050 [Ahaetulla prasina]|uniref:uncharacterized protein LOC131191050 n=1 Tax=Ahaetulla prasina TaxID=499056 RepID=UPI00264A093D|nr:uncharacterized protein LOC131191050 [Ahaetulla prasina]XP_058024753.1 uncharacterized protein LOC131191050 [Ahaetulla prasina]XP_058024754.1 uncharacterized protein LOC131191050 [Ahaetulla prasina]XP_058024755.1 uncharacterized protein LOC131191050 [Ahaetulla prasina]